MFNVFFTWILYWRITLEFRKYLTETFSLPIIKVFCFFTLGFSRKKQTEAFFHHFYNGFSPVFHIWSQETRAMRVKIRLEYVVLKCINILLMDCAVLKHTTLSIRDNLCTTAVPLWFRDYSGIWFRLRSFFCRLYVRINWENKPQGPSPHATLPSF